MFRKITMLFVVSVAVVATYMVSGKNAPVEPSVSNDIVLMVGDRPVDVVSFDNGARAKGKKQGGKSYSLLYGKQDVVSADDSVQVWIE